MSIDIERHIARLVAQRDRLEDFLARHAGFARLRQARLDAIDADALQQLTVEVERDLAGHPLLAGWHALSDAITVLAELQTELAAPPAAAAASHAMPLIEPAGVVGADAASMAATATPAPAESAADGAAEIVEAVVTAPTLAEVETPPAARAATLRTSVAAPPPTLRQIELLARSRSSPTGVVTRTAVLHAGPPGSARAATGPLSAKRPADDLTRIRGIDRKLAEDLEARGIRTFDDIAAFGTADVRTLAAALALGRRISAENWIEQATVLAARQAAARRNAEAAAVAAAQAKPLLVSPAAPGLALAPTAIPSATPEATAPQIAVIPAVATAETVPAATAAAPTAAPPVEQPSLPPLIRAVAERIALATTRPAAATIVPVVPEIAPTAATEPAAVPAETAPPVIAELDALPLQTEPHQSVASQQPAEPDAASAEPADDAVAAPLEAETAAPDGPITIVRTLAASRQGTVAASEGEGTSPLDPVTWASRQPLEHRQNTGVQGASPLSFTSPEQQRARTPASDDTADAVQLSEPAALPPALPAAPELPPDDLQAIRGIDAELESALSDLGVSRYGEIAAWSPREVDVVKLALGPAARIHRDGWIEQAAVLASGKPTAHAARRAAGLPHVTPPPPEVPHRDPVFAMWLARQTSALPIPRPAPAIAAAAAPEVATAAAEPDEATAPPDAAPMPTEGGAIDTAETVPAASAPEATSPGPIDTATSAPVVATVAEAPAPEAEPAPQAATDDLAIAAPAPCAEVASAAADSATAQAGQPATSDSPPPVSESAPAAAVDARPPEPRAEPAPTDAIATAPETTAPPAAAPEAAPSESAAAELTAPEPAPPEPSAADAIAASLPAEQPLGHLAPRLSGELPPPLLPTSGAGDLPPPLPASATDTQSAQPESTPLQAISDRMRALERDLAALDIVPLSPTQSRRMQLQKAPPTAPASDAGLWHDDGLKEAGAEPMSAEGAMPPAADYAGDGLPVDGSIFVFDEADVTIVRRAAREIGLEPLPAEPPAARGKGTDDDFDKDEYAAYRERVEEAMVEIVTPGGRPASEQPPAEGAATAGGDGSPAPANPVRRFLKALTGD